MGRFFFNDEDEKIIKQVDADGNTGKAILPMREWGKAKNAPVNDGTEDLNVLNNNGGNTTEAPEQETNWGAEYDKVMYGQGASGQSNPGASEGQPTGQPTNASPAPQVAISGGTNWKAELDNIMQQIQGQGQFSYDMNGDAMYKQYEDIYKNQAKLGMENAMAQAAAMTGGYGSSYAQQVGQQAYAQQMQELNQVGMDLYDRAFARDQAEKDQLMQQYAMIADREALEYNREYQKERDEVEDTQWKAEYDRYIANDKIAKEQWQAEFDREGKWYDDAQEATNPNTTYEGEGDLNGQSVPKQIAGVQGLTTTNTSLFDDNGNFKQAAVVSVDRVNSYNEPHMDDVVTYNFGGKEVKLRRGYSPYTNTMNPDAANGTFNGYQPDNIAGEKLQKIGQEALVNGQWVPIYKTKDGTEWVYDAANNVYFNPKDEEEKKESTSPTEFK